MTIVIKWSNNLTYTSLVHLHNRLDKLDSNIFIKETTAFADCIDFSTLE